MKISMRYFPSYLNKRNFTENMTPWHFIYTYVSPWILYKMLLDKFFCYPKSIKIQFAYKFRA